MTLRRLHDLGHRELFGHDFALVNPLRVPGDRWSDLPVVPLRAPAFAAQAHLVPKLLPLGGQEFSAISKYTLCYERAHHLTDVMAGISKTNNGGRKHEFARLF